MQVMRGELCPDCVLLHAADLGFAICDAGPWLAYLVSSQATNRPPVVVLPVAPGLLEHVAERAVAKLALDLRLDRAGVEAVEGPEMVSLFRLTEMALAAEVEA